MPVPVHSGKSNGPVNGTPPPRRQYPIYLSAVTAAATVAREAMEHLHLRFALMLSLAFSLWAPVLGQAVVLAPAPPICFDSTIGEAWPAELTVPLRIHVQGPHGDEPPGQGAAANRGTAFLRLKLLDSGLVYEAPLLIPLWAQVEMGASVRINVPSRRRLGLAAYSLNHGFDEVVIEPLSPEGESGGLPVETTLHEVTLRLPGRRPLGEVEYQPPASGAGGVRLQKARASLRLPLTGIVIAGSGFGSRSAPGLFALVPPGEYRLEVEPFSVRFCGESPVECPDAAGWEELITVRPPEKTRIVRPFLPGVQLQAHFDLLEASPAQTQAMTRDRDYLSSGWWDAGALGADPGRWLVSVTLAKWDEQAGTYARPRPVQWISMDRRWASGVAPLAVHVNSSTRWAPGRYQVMITGPMVKTAVFRLDVGSKDRGTMPLSWGIEASDG